MAAFSPVGKRPVAAEFEASGAVTYTLTADKGDLTLSGKASTLDVDIAANNNSLVLTGSASTFARFAPPRPPPPLEIIPDWLSSPDIIEAPEPDPVEFPRIGYSDPLALKAEIEAAEDERDAMPENVLGANPVKKPTTLSK